MEAKKIFKENMPIEVFDEDSGVYYKSIIQEVDEVSLAIGVPMKRQNQLLMRDNNTYNLRLAVGDALYSFNSKMIGRRRSGNILLFILEWPDEIKRSQRRQFFRISTAMDGHFWLIEKGRGNADAAPDELSLDVEDIVEPESQRAPLNLRQPLNKLVECLGEPDKAVVLDISGGGLAMSVSYFIPEGSLLAVRIFLESKESKKIMLLKGRVVRSFSMDSGKGLIRYRLGIDFEDMSEKVRDELINFIFVLSREKTR